MSAVLFADAVAVVIAGIDPALTIPVHHDVPNPRPAQFVRVFRTGGVRNTRISDAPQLTVEAWASRSLPAETAQDNAQLARSALNNLEGSIILGTQVYRVDELSGPAELPDPESDDRRITWSVIVHLRGA